MDSIQTLYGKCRCCLKAGEHRDVFKVYYCDGTREVYFDIFLECFNVFLSISSGNGNLICADCIQKLRDASNFRNMVVDAEKQLQFRLLSRSDDVTPVMGSNSNNCERADGGSLTGTTGMKVKDPPDLETQQEVTLVKLEPDDGYDNMEIEYKDVNVPPDLDIKQEGERGKEEERKEKADDHDYMETEFKDGKKTRSKNVEALLRRETESESKKKSDQSHVTEETAHIHNAQLILEHSNVTAFKGKTIAKVALLCFYCKDLFDNIEALRTHQKEHKKSDMTISLHSLSPYCFIVNVDITDLKCTLCDASFNTLEEFKSHLESKHNKKFYTEFEDRVIPFKVPMDNNYICQICGLKLESLGSIERHMNGHFRNYKCGNYNCDKCGRRFVTNQKLNTHVRTINVKGSFQCDSCKKVFSSQQMLKSHVDTVHKMLKRFKCTKCPERFTAYFQRYQHVVEIHGQAMKLYYKVE